MNKEKAVKVRVSEDVKEEKKLPCKKCGGAMFDKRGDPCRYCNTEDIEPEE